MRDGSPALVEAVLASFVLGLVDFLDICSLDLVSARPQCRKAASTMLRSLESQMKVKWRAKTYW